MRRAVQKFAKPQRDFDEIIQPEESKSAILVSTNKSRKIKNSERGIRLCRLRGSESKEDTSRARSASPVSPPVEAVLPLGKFNKIYSKIVAQMEMVKVLSSNKTNETENLLDLRRRLQRADEFSIRFSRNNLYETRRIINDIKKLVVAYPCEKSETYTAVFKKIILAFQAVSQGLQSYINYVQNPSNLEVPDKINELVIIIAELILYCEQISIPMNNEKLKNGAVKICNELMMLFKSKIPVCKYVEFKVDPKKKKSKVIIEEVEKTNKFSMYKPKMVSKLKAELPKRKNSNFFLTAKMKKPACDKTARVIHEIYTQKLNPWEGNGFNENKNVKFEPSEEKIENQVERKPSFRKNRFGTPREVRCQDDDVETVVQSICDDETLSKIATTPREPDNEKKDFKDLVLQAVEELKGDDDQTDRKLTLNKLLNSIQKCSETPTNDRVKVFHFLSEDLLKELRTEKTEPEIQTADNQTVNTEVEEEKEIPQEVPLKGRRFMRLFKPLRPNEDVTGEVVSKGKLQLKLSEEAMNNANKYKKAFADYRKINIMYKRSLTNTPWELVGKVSDRIIHDLIKEISQDFQNDSMLKGLYLSELLEVTS